MITSSGSPARRLPPSHVGGLSRTLSKTTVADGGHRCSLRGRAAACRRQRLTLPSRSSRTPVVIRISPSCSISSWSVVVEKARKLPHVLGREGNSSRRPASGRGEGSSDGWVGPFNAELPASTDDQDAEIDNPYRISEEDALATMADSKVNRLSPSVSHPGRPPPSRGHPQDGRGRAGGGPAGSSSSPSGGSPTGSRR